MSASVRILHLEDSTPDRELIQHMLRDDGMACEVTPCGDQAGFREALDHETFDLIFADCTVPGFSGLDALEMARKNAPHVPFIFVSGTLNEDTAIESLRNGATDYVLKNRLGRLIPAVRRALAEAKERARAHALSRRLRQSQRLQAVGTLAGGVAHDFNNILTIIRGYVSLLPQEAHRPERIQEIAATIDRASGRGSELVNQLLAFARKTNGIFAATDINQRVREVVSLLRPSLPASIAFASKLAPDLPEINADPGQLDRVLINLATNARDAMPDGGTLTFSTSRVPLHDVPAHEDSAGCDHYVCLRVTDTGCGMDEVTRLRIFEPFFTTKPRGKGTGLGMPVVYGLMQTHKGFVDVVSEPGAGTSVALYFPEPLTPLSHVDRPACETVLGAIDGTETILIVDDEPDVRYLLEIILQSHGYKVLAASSAAAALEIIPRHPGQIRLLFSDVGLPGLDGFQLSAQARKLQPDLCTVLCSGYADHSLKTRMAAEGIDGFIAKPYETGALLQVIRSAMDKQ